MTDNPDALPKAALNHGMDGIVLELTSVYNLAELESSYLAFLMNVEGLASSLIDTWKNQGSGDNIQINVGIISGLVETINWVRVKAETLIDSSKLI